MLPFVRLVSHTQPKRLYTWNSLQYTYSLWFGCCQWLWIWHNASIWTLNYKCKALTVLDGKCRLWHANEDIFYEIWNWFELCGASAGPCYEASGEAMSPSKFSAVSVWQPAGRTAAGPLTVGASWPSLPQTMHQRSKGLWLSLWTSVFGHQGSIDHWAAEHANNLQLP